MADLISRQAAIEDVKSWVAVDGREKHLQKDVIEWLKEFPSAQSERKKGEWIATYSDCGSDVWVSWKCSNCGYVRKKGWEHANDGEKPDALFCEMCNADMRGEYDG